MPVSSVVSPGDVILASDHNEERQDILDGTLGHKHTITTDDGAGIDIVAAVVRNNWSGIADDNNLTTSVLGTSALTLTTFYALFTAGGGVGDYINSKDNFVFTTDDLDMDDYLDLLIPVQAGAATAQDIFFGSADFATAAVTPANATSIIRHLGFFIEDGTLYASNADGTTQTSTDISAGITVSEKHTCRVVRDTSEIRFYVDNVLKATHTTNLPTGNSHKLFRGITTQAGNRNLYFGTVHYSTTNFGG